MLIGDGLKRLKAGVETIHQAEILDSGATEEAENL